MGYRVIENEIMPLPPFVDRFLPKFFKDAFRVEPSIPVSPKVGSLGEAFKLLKQRKRQLQSSGRDKDIVLDIEPVRD